MGYYNAAGNQEGTIAAPGLRMPEYSNLKLKAQLANWLHRIRYDQSIGAPTVCQPE